VTTAIYSLAVALLLMTSLRGWYITGHDIQREYRVFQLTKSNGNWKMSRFQDAYNACLSITILPTLVAQMTRIADPYVYKLIFQLIFAYCPVLVYKLARRYASKGTAILAVVYFISFPTFFGDMPFLNRQEIAFMFVAAAFLMMSNGEAGLTTRRVFIAACSLGVVVSHYSTTYVIGGTLLAAWLLGRCAPLALPAVNAARRRLKRIPLNPQSAARTPVIGLVNIVILIGASLLWTGAYTHTYSGLRQTLSAAVQSIRGSPEPGTRAAEVRYSLFSLGAPSVQTVWHDYITNALDESRTGRAQGVYYPESLLSQYPTPIITEKSLPVTSIGHALDAVGVNVATFNSAIRAAAARLYQVFLFVGLAAALFSRRRRFAPGWEFYAIAWGAAIVVLVQVLVPVISIDYGVLRAFQQALVVLCPFVAFGTVTLFSWLRGRWSLAASAGVAIFFFLSLTGVLPQLLGGYPPQLNLNNSGLYYDLFYVHPQEVKAIGWLTALVATKPGAVQSEVETDRYTFQRLQTFTGVNPNLDIFPDFLTKNAYVFLGFQTVQKDQSAILYDGDIILYKYPTSLLDRQENLIYSSNGVHIYK